MRSILFLSTEAVRASIFFAPSTPLIYQTTMAINVARDRAAYWINRADEPTDRNTEVEVRRALRAQGIVWYQPNISRLLAGHETRYPQYISEKIDKFLRTCRPPLISDHLDPFETWSTRPHNSADGMKIGLATYLGLPIDEVQLITAEAVFPEPSREEVKEFEIQGGQIDRRDFRSLTHSDIGFLVRDHDDDLNESKEAYISRQVAFLRWLGSQGLREGIRAHVLFLLHQLEGGVTQIEIDRVVEEIKRLRGQGSAEEMNRLLDVLVESRERSLNPHDSEVDAYARQKMEDLFRENAGYLKLIASAVGMNELLSFIDRAAEDLMNTHGDSEEASRVLDDNLSLFFIKQIREPESWLRLSRHPFPRVRRKVIQHILTDVIGTDRAKYVLSIWDQQKPLIARDLCSSNDRVIFEVVMLLGLFVREDIRDALTILQRAADNPDSRYFHARVRLALIRPELIGNADEDDSSN